LDLGVNCDVRGKDSIDCEFLAVGFGEVEEPADVVILVVAGKEPIGLGRGETEGGESHRLAKINGV